MRKHSFLRGAMVLSLAGLISKFIGVAYRIPLARLLGGEGLGLYQMAYPFYTMILAVSTAGIPVAISLLVAEKQAQGDPEGARRVFHIALILLSLSGALFAFFLFQGSYFLAREVLHEERSFYPIIAISPAIFFTAVISAFRGYFQGLQVMIPTAWSQVLEQLVRVGTVLFVASLLLPYGLEFAAAGATFGAVAGSFAALILLSIIYWNYCQKGGKHNYKILSRRRRTREPAGILLKRIISIGLPLSAGGLVMPVMQMIDATMVPLRLQAAGYDVTRATDLFGQFSGMAVTLVNIPTIVTSSLAMSLVPAIAEATARADLLSLRRRVAAAIRLTVVFCLPAATGLWALAVPISVLLYNLAEVGNLLAVLAPTALFLGLYQTTSGVLQGMGETFIPVRNLMLGAVLKIILNYYLTGSPAWGIRGAAISTVIGFAFAFILNYRVLRKRIIYGPVCRVFLPKLFLAVTIMALSVRAAYNFVVWEIGAQALGTLIAIGCGFVVYLLASVFLKTLDEAELRQVPILGRVLVGFTFKNGKS